MFNSEKKKNTISDDTLTIFFHNVGSLSNHLGDIVSDDRIINNDVIGFIEAQINLSDSTCRLIETLNFFNVRFNNRKK